MKTSLIDRIVYAYTRKNLHKKRIVEAHSIDELKAGHFNRLRLEGSLCADGSPDNVYLFPGDEKSLIISFCGGGVITSADDCRYPMSISSLLTNRKMLYVQNCGEMFEFASFLINKNLGILSPEEENLFASWSKVIIPYVNGDFHTGTSDFTYTEEDGSLQEFHCNGYTNFIKVMEKTKALWPSPDRILVTGASAGSFGASALAGKVAEFYPECQNITAYCDSSYLPWDNWKAIAEGLWKCPKEVSDPIHSNDIGGDWLEALCRNYGDRIKILYSCSTRDGVLARFSRFINEGIYKIKVDEKWLNVVHEGFVNRIKCFEKEGISIRYYVNEIGDKLSGGTKHCISQDKEWSRHQVGGVTPAQWVMDGINGKLYDVGLELLDQSI